MWPGLWELKRRGICLLSHACDMQGRGSRESRCA